MSTKNFLAQTFKWATTAVLGFWMSIPTSIHILLLLIFADFVTGLAAAFVQKKVDSSIGRRGAVRKALIFLLVLVVHLAEVRAGLTLGTEKWFAAYFIFLEFISIIENVSRAGIPMPAPLIEGLVKLKTLYPKQMNAEEVHSALHPECPKDAR